MVNAFALGWLRGMYDGEGCVLVRLAPSGKALQSRITLVNTSKLLVDTACAYLAELGIPYRLQYGHATLTMRGTVWNEKWTVWIDTHPAILLFAQHIGFTDPGKAARLQRAVDYITRPIVVRRRSLTGPLARDLYDSGLTYRQMAKMYGYASARSVWLIVKRAFPDHVSRKWGPQRKR